MSRKKTRNWQITNQLTPEKTDAHRNQSMSNETLPWKNLNIWNLSAKPNSTKMIRKRSKYVCFKQGPYILSNTCPNEKATQKCVTGWAKMQQMLRQDTRLIGAAPSVPLPFLNHTQSKLRNRISHTLCSWWDWNSKRIEFKIQLRSFSFSGKKQEDLTITAETFMIFIWIRRTLTFPVRKLPQFPVCWSRGPMKNTPPKPSCLPSPTKRIHPHRLRHVTFLKEQSKPQQKLTKKTTQMSPFLAKLLVFERLRMWNVQKHN